MDTQQLSVPSNSYGYTRAQAGRGRGRGGRGFNQGNNRGHNHGPMPTRGVIPLVRGNINGRGRGRGSYKPYNTLPVVMGPPPADFTPVPVSTPTPVPNQSGAKAKGKGKPNNNHTSNSSKAFRGRAGGLGFKTMEDRPRILNPYNRPLLIPPVFVRAKERLFEVDPEELLRAHEVPPHAFDQLDPQTDLLAAAFEDNDDETKQKHQISRVELSGQETPAGDEEATAAQKSDAIIVQDEVEVIIEDYDNEKTMVATNDLLDALRDAAGGGHPRDMRMTPSPDGKYNITEAAESLYFFDSTGTQNPAANGTDQAIIYDKANASALMEENDEPDEILLIPSLTARRSASTASPKSQPEAVISAAPERADIPTHHPTDHPTMPTLPIQHVPALTMNTLNLSFEKASKQPNQSLSSFSIPQSSRSARMRVPVRARKEAKRTKSKHQGSRDIAWTNNLGNVFGFKDGREGLRQGDSDLEVGSTSEREDGLEPDNGMDVDEGLDPIAMTSFAMNVNRQHMSAHDIEIEEAIKRGGISSDGEDDGQEQDQSGDSDESGSERDEENSSEDGAFDEELEIHEAILMDESDSSWEEEDPDISSNTKFTRRIQKIRERTPGHSDLDQFNERSKADKDEDFLADLEEILDQNADILSSRDRKARKEVLVRAIQKDDPHHPFAVMTSRSGQDKDRADLLAEQWEKDRNKKAERKRLREAQRLAQGGLGNGKVKGQKQKTKHLPDLEDIEEMMRDLLASRSTSHGPGAPKSFTLPALPKPVRERVHAMAQALQLKSTSSGKKKAEVKTMTISLSNKSGTWTINERKLNRVLQRKGGRGNGASGLHGIQEGEVIGHKAEKISQNNIGYKLLAQMGWSEGDRIGREGGLVDPVTAVMKKSKLGLGAFRE